MTPETVAIVVLIAVAAVWGFHTFMSWWVSREDWEEYFTAYPTLTRMDDVVYAYDQHGEFIGQGKTWDQLFAVMTLNLPRKEIVVDVSELKKVGWIDVK